MKDGGSDVQFPLHFSPISKISLDQSRTKNFGNITYQLISFELISFHRTNGREVSDIYSRPTLVHVISKTEQLPFIPLTLSQCTFIAMVEALEY